MLPVRSDGKKRLKRLKPTKKKTIYFFSLDLQQQNDRKTFWNTAPSMSQYDTCGCRSSLVTAWKWLPCLAATIFVCFFYLLCCFCFSFSRIYTPVHEQTCLPHNTWACTHTTQRQFYNLLSHFFPPPPCWCTHLDSPISTKLKKNKTES